MVGKGLILKTDLTNSRSKECACVAGKLAKVTYLLGSAGLTLPRSGWGSASPQWAPASPCRQAAGPQVRTAGVRTVSAMAPPPSFPPDQAQPKTPTTGSESGCVSAISHYLFDKCAND